MRLAPVLQVPPSDSLSIDHDGNQSPGLGKQQPHFHREQSVTSAVDYEHFDVGIGQVPHMHTGLLVLGSTNSLKL